MVIQEYNDSYEGQFFEFLKNESTSNELATVNMWHDNWREYPNSLPYKLLVEKIFNHPKGVLFLIFDNDNIIGCSGAYISNIHEDLLIAGARTWVSKKYRNLQLIRELLLPAQKKWAVDNNLKAIALTFNEYNSNLIQAFKRNRLGESRTKREPHHLFYNGVETIEFPVTIQHTKQYVIYEKLTDWDFNWETIKYIE